MNDKFSMQFVAFLLFFFLPFGSNAANDAIFTVVPTVFTSEIKKHEVTTRLPDDASATEVNVNYALIAELRAMGFKYVPKGAPVVFDVSVNRASKATGAAIYTWGGLGGAKNTFSDVTDILISATFDGKRVWEGSISGKTEDLAAPYTRTCLKNLFYEYEKARTEDEDCDANP